MLTMVYYFAVASTHTWKDEIILGEADVLGIWSMHAEIISRMMM